MLAMATHHRHRNLITPAQPHHRLTGRGGGTCGETGGRSDRPCLSQERNSTAHAYRDSDSRADGNSAAQRRPAGKDSAKAKSSTAEKTAAKTDTATKSKTDPETE